MLFRSLFKPLTEAEIEQVVELMLGALRSRLAERQISLDISADAVRFIARQGFDPVYGARPLRRFIAREVETRIARALVAGDVEPGSVIEVRIRNDELSVTHHAVSSGGLQ